MDKCMATARIIIEHDEFPYRGEEGSENYRVRGETSDGQVSWTGRGFVRRAEALAYADAVYTGTRLVNASATIDDRSAVEEGETIE